jgi:hypothetical protein
MKLKVKVVGVVVFFAVIGLWLFSLSLYAQNVTDSEGGLGVGPGVGDITEDGVGKAEDIVEIGEYDRDSEENYQDSQEDVPDIEDDILKESALDKLQVERDEAWVAGDTEKVSRLDQEIANLKDNIRADMEEDVAESLEDKKDKAEDIVDIREDIKEEKLDMRNEESASIDTGGGLIPPPPPPGQDQEYAGPGEGRGMYRGEEQGVSATPKPPVEKQEPAKKSWWQIGG